MIIRQITHDDIPKLIEIGLMCHQESEYNIMSFSANKCIALCERIISEPQMLGMVTVKDNETTGVLVAAAIPAYFSDEINASDLLVYVPPEYRGTRAFYLLCLSYIGWARTKGARLIFLRNTTGIEADKVGRLYERMGFSRVGGIYRMEA
ncbi:MAG: GNAT family N-acetyltransferase [Dehalococcoidia bacterium]